MTIDTPQWLDERVPRGSIVRFSIAGCFNSALFFLLWATLLVVLPDEDVRLLWGFCWGLTGILAHYVHRWFTFDDRKPVSWTLPTAVPVYFGSLFGSSITIGWFNTAFPQHLRAMGLVNLVAWGVVVWMLMRFLVFQYSYTERESQEHPEV